ncbi:YdeI/OmpD-associated family protein [Kribbella sp. NPDC051770]|uniref:YdeI/OmpD-associated family protein n=1 Tax=Kribbella sp. NPDC051770 TaxID=3155413 RepID=UPI0034136C1F
MSTYLGESEGMENAAEVSDEVAVRLAGVGEWRAWLEAHGEVERAVWLVVGRGGGGVVDYLAAVEQALCFGWVDSKTVRRDAVTTYQCFTPRSVRSTWSKVNRERVARLAAEGLMAPAGMAVVERAKASGVWDVLAEAQELIVPGDLRRELDGNAEADKHFRAFPPSSRRLILEWVALAKRPETRARRIRETVELAEIGRRANHRTPTTH